MYSKLHEWDVWVKGPSSVSAVFSSQETDKKGVQLLTNQVFNGRSRPLGCQILYSIQCGKEPQRYKESLTSSENIEEF